MSRAVWMEQGEVVQLPGRKGFKVATAFATPDPPHGRAACSFAECA